MHGREFLTTAATGTSILAFPAVLRAQSKDPIRIGFPLPLTGTFAAIAADMKRGAELSWDEFNANGVIMGLQHEVLHRDDKVETAVEAQLAHGQIDKQKPDREV